MGPVLGMEGEVLWVSKQREQGVRSRDFWSLSENRLRTNEKLGIKAATSRGAILTEAKQGSQRDGEQTHSEQTVSDLQRNKTPATQHKSHGWTAGTSC